MTRDFPSRVAIRWVRFASIAGCWAKIQLPGGLAVVYLAADWADDAPRSNKAGVPQDLGLTTKPGIALAQIERLMAQGAPKYCVLADPGYGLDAAFRERLSELALNCVVGVSGKVTA